jgi:cation diffusion facilitator family transporter
VGLWLSSQPADSSYPEGYERFESLIGLAISLVILGTGGFVLWDAYQSLVAEPGIEISQLAIVLVSVSIAVKGATGWFLWHEGNRLDSPPLNAIGRDQTGDMLADGAVISAMAAVYYNLHWLDPFVAGIIGISILLIGWSPFKKHLNDLTGGAPTADIRTEIETIMNKIPLFGQITSLRAHHVGPTLHVSLTTEAPAEARLKEVHQAEETLRRKILNLPDVSRVFIHVEPPSADSPN